jgi:2-amino-4-ketopentanoate thiolase alpha subunit
MTIIQKGTWVEIEQIVLQPEQRAPSLPEETRKVPYTLRVSGFLSENGEVGQEVKIQTIIGRELSGTLKNINPGYSHSFGNTIPELLRIGTDWEKQ